MIMSSSRCAALRVSALLACAGLAAAPAAAQVQVTLRPLAPPEAFFVADLLPGSSAARPDLIGITLVSSTTSPPVAGSRSPTTANLNETISLEIVVSRESPSPAEIFRGTTGQFTMTQPIRHLTVRDLASSGRDVSITDFTVNDEALGGTAGRSGRLQPGTYLFRVIVHDSRGGTGDSDELRITFTSPSRVELLAPGSSTDISPPTVLGPTPRFLWSADGEAPGARYRLRVVKVDDRGSAVEAVQSGFPAWDATVTGTSVFYPASAQALRLEPGATYAWQITRELRTSGGVELVESPIYWFRVGGAGAPSPAAGALAMRLAALLRALGLSGLEGFSPIGATTEDGQVISLEKLEELLAAIEAGEIAVLDARVR
jgi:hypothetical protein